MIVWSGFGLIVPIIGFFLPLIIIAAIDSVFGSGFATSHAVPRLFSGLTLSATFFFLGTWMNSNSDEDRAKMSKKDEVVSVFNQKHSFLFIPVQYWGLIFLPFAVLVAFL